VGAQERPRRTEYRADVRDLHSAKEADRRREAQSVRLFFSFFTQRLIFLGLTGYLVLARFGSVQVQGTLCRTLNLNLAFGSVKS
jgi:hypothetical protein